LKKLEEMKKGALPELNAAQAEGIAGSLALALQNRRGAIAPTYVADDDSEYYWSD
jgi:hypothetical protein